MIDGCIAAGQTRLVRNWFNMWNSHVVEVLQRLTLFGTPVFSIHVMIYSSPASTTHLAVVALSLHMDARLRAYREFKPPRNPLY
jgi:hypothetical protein